LPLEKAAHLAMDRRVKPGDDSLGWAAMAANPAKPWLEAIRR